MLVTKQRMSTVQFQDEYFLVNSGSQCIFSLETCLVNGPKHMMFLQKFLVHRDHIVKKLKAETSCNIF